MSSMALPRGGSGRSVVHRERQTSKRLPLTGQRTRARADFSMADRLAGVSRKKGVKSPRYNRKDYEASDIVFVHATVGGSRCCPKLFQHQIDPRDKECGIGWIGRCARRSRGHRKL